MSLANWETTLMYAIDDTCAGHNVPSVPLGDTEDGKTIVMKAVFADEDSAKRMASHLDSQAGQEGRFVPVMVELWRPTDIELLVRKRIREHEESKGPKLIIPGN